MLEIAVSKMKDSLPDEYSKITHAICVGLACLPPHIPIEVLSRVTTVSSEAIKSFVADIGGPLWISDTSIQFRDEPTESWLLCQIDFCLQIILLRQEVFGYNVYNLHLELPLNYLVFYHNQVLPKRQNLIDIIVACYIKVLYVFNFILSISVVKRCFVLSL